MQRAAALENWANRVESGELVEADTATLQARRRLGAGEVSEARW